MLRDPLLLSQVKCDLWNNFNAESQRRGYLIAIRSQVGDQDNTCYGMDNAMVKKRISTDGDNIKASCQNSTSRRKRAVSGTY
jgi:hypothetical protein